MPCLWQSVRGMNIVGGDLACMMRAKDGHDFEMISTVSRRRRTSGARSLDPNWCKSGIEVTQWNGQSAVCPVLSASR